MDWTFFVNYIMGVVNLAQFKRIQVSLPESLISDMDSLVEKCNSDRSKIVVAAMKHYLKQRKKISFKADLRKGYQEMAEINLCLAEQFLESDCIQLREYEQRLEEMD
jgi:CopG family transcriptional regulator/antitoxin EndoAI